MNVVTGSAHEGSRSGDFELNLAPIIDCFTVLITFMLVSASFLAVGVMGAGMEVAGQTNDGSTRPQIHLEVTLQAGNTLQVETDGTSTMKKLLAPANGSWDLVSLERELTAVKQAHADLSAITLSANNDVPYVSVVQVMEVARRVTPNILFGGF